MLSFVVIYVSLLSMFSLINEARRLRFEGRSNVRVLVLSFLFIFT